MSARASRRRILRSGRARRWEAIREVPGNASRWYPARHRSTSGWPRRWRRRSMPRSRRRTPRHVDGSARAAGGSGARVGVRARAAAIDGERVPSTGASGVDAAVAPSRTDSTSAGTKGLGARGSPGWVCCAVRIRHASSDSLRCRNVDDVSGSVRPPGSPPPGSWGATSSHSSGEAGGHRCGATPDDEDAQEDRDQGGDRDHDDAGDDKLGSHAPSVAPRRPSR